MTKNIFLVMCFVNLYTLSFPVRNARTMKPASDNPSMAQRIARTLPSLTRSHRKMADYVLSHPFKVATMAIDELATALGVSVATANRFARALGFDGYPQFRAALVLGFESALAPVEKLRSRVESPATAADVFMDSLSNIQRNISLTQQSLDAHTCEQAVNAVLSAKRIGIIGFGASTWLGGLLQRGLDPLCGNVQLLATIEGSSAAARVISRLQTSDLLIAIGFPRYAADTVFLAQRACEAGVPVLALTDRVTSPLARLATVSLYVHTESHYFSNCEASALALVEALCSAVAHRTQGSIKAATELAESLLPWIYGNPDSALRSLPGTSTTVSRRKKEASRKATGKGTK